MNGSILVLGIVGVCVIWFILKLLYFDKVDREQDVAIRKALDSQAQKHHGTVAISKGRPTLTIPHKGVEIELSCISNNVELYNEYTYARFQTDSFTEKDFLIALNSKELLLKPVVIGTRIEISDVRFSEAFVVTGNDAAFVNDLLTEDIREMLCKESFQIKFGRRTDSFTLSRERGWLSVFTQGMRTGEAAFDALIETAILFYERLEVLKGRALEHTQ
jgi:hypothetical protein